MYPPVTPQNQPQPQPYQPFPPPQGQPQPQSSGAPPQAPQQQQPATSGPPGTPQPGQAPQGPYGFPKEVYEQEFAAAQEYVAQQKAAAREGQGPPRDQYGRFVSPGAGQAEPGQPQQTSFDPRLVERARDLGLTDLSNIADNRHLSDTITQKSVANAHQLARTLGIDVNDLADFIQSRGPRPAQRPAEPQQQPPAQQPAAQPAQAQAPATPAFEVPIDEQMLDPSVAEPLKAIVAKINELSSARSDPNAEKIAALERQLQQFAQAQQLQHQTDVGAAWDQAASAVGLDRVFGISPTAAIAAANAGNHAAPGVAGWSSFVNEFFAPAWETMLNSGHPDAPQTIQAAMAQALANARTVWAQRAGGQQNVQPTYAAPFQQFQQPIQPPPQGVIRAESRVSPYMGNTYAPNDPNSLFDPEYENALWARNGGHNPYRSAMNGR